MNCPCGLPMPVLAGRLKLQLPAWPRATPAPSTASPAGPAALRCTVPRPDCPWPPLAQVLAVDNLSGARVAGRVVRVEHVDNYRKKKAEVG